MELSELKDNLGKELITSTEDIVYDIGEIGLDSVFEEGVLQEIPILKTIAAVCKVGLNIRDRYFSKKLIGFINEYRKRNFDSENQKQFRERMMTKEFYNKVTEKLIIILDGLIEENRARMLALLFNRFIDQYIGWNDFCLYSRYIDLLTDEDFETLKYLRTDVINGYCLDTSEKSNLEGAANKLIYFGFVKSKSLHTGLTFGTAPNTVIHYITETGTKFIDCFNDGDWV